MLTDDLFTAPLPGRSFDVVTYEPRNPDAWHEPYARLCGCLAGG